MGDARSAIERLRSDLRDNRSATRTLEAWCRTHHLGDPPVVRALVKSKTTVSSDSAEYATLGVGASETVRLRHVLLTCGACILSEARNWYVPARLTAEMNQRLDATDLPFGKVVACLDFERHTLASTLLWRPQSLCEVPEHLFENRAILTQGPDRLPFAVLVETYRRGVLPTS